MSSPTRAAGQPPEGLRERKRLQTRERITKAAMTLFLGRGFDTTTVDEIATAAEVSKRSFFDYFPTKEDVIFAWQDEFGAALATAVATRPTNEPLVKVVEKALTSAIVTAVADPRALAIGQLIHETPALRARDQLKYAKLEQRLAEALAERAKSEDEQLRARLLAMIAVGGLRVAGEAWQATQPGETVEAYSKKIFKAIWAELREFGHSGENAATI